MELLQVQLFRAHSNINPIHRARIYLLSILRAIVIILWGVFIVCGGSCAISWVYIHCMWGGVYMRAR